MASLEASGVDVSSEEDADSTGTAFIVSGPELAGSDGLVSVDTSPEACFLSEASSLSTGASSSSGEGADTFSTVDISLCVIVCEMKRRRQRNKTTGINTDNTCAGLCGGLVGGYFCGCYG